MRPRATAVPARQVFWGSMRWLQLALVAFAYVSLAACSGVKLVADYDAEAAKAITDTSADVFAFYDRMIEAKAKAAGKKLPYATFNEDWGKIETRIRVLMVREESRPLNSESQRIARTILGFWQKYRLRHQSSDDYTAALLPIHRDRFQRLFTAALVAERAKRLADPDSDPKLDND
jgi:hypothetical protein